MLKDKGLDVKSPGMLNIYVKNETVKEKLFTAFYDSYYDSWSKFANGIVRKMFRDLSGTECFARDSFHEGLLVFYKAMCVHGFRQTDPPAEVKTVLFTFCANWLRALTTSHIRGIKLQKALQRSYTHRKMQAPEVLWKTALQDALKTLNADERLLFTLRYIDGLGIEDIVEKLRATTGDDRTASTIRTYVSRIGTQVKNYLRKN